MTRNQKQLSRQISKLFSRFIAISPRELTSTAEYLDLECRKIHQPTSLIFPVAFTLHALASIPAALRTSAVDSYQQKVARYLSKQGSAGTFNYWQRSSAQAAKWRLPDDVDDTACALAALVRAGEQINEKAFFATVELEARTGGPYTTWYINREQDVDNRWQDIDPVVNAHFLYFAATYGVELPHTLSFLRDCLKKGNTKSPYYLSELIFFVYLARYAAAARDSDTVDAILAALPLYSDSFLLADKLYYSLILLYCHQDLPPTLSKEINQLAQSRRPIPATPICYGFDIAKGVHSFVGSSTVSTALLLEILSLQYTRQFPPQDGVVAKAQQAYVQIFSSLTNDVAHHRQRPHLQQNINWQLQYRAITLPCLIAYSYFPKLTKSQLHNLTTFAKASFWGWLEYTLLDDILDNQKPASALVTMLLCHDLRIGAAVDLPRWWHEFMQHSWQKINDYYLWETEHGRLPADLNDYHLPKLNNDYILARMAPFLQGISSLFRLLNLPAHMELWESFFQNLFILDQLDDDSHDWEEDMNAGIRTSTVDLVLRLHRQHPHQKLSDVYWQHALPQVLKWADKAHHQAESSLKMLSPHLQQTKIWEQMLAKSYGPFALAHQERSYVDKYLTRPQEQTLTD